MRSLRLVGFALVWLVAETVALIALAGLWVVSGFGGRLRTEPYQSRHYGVMRWFLDTMYRGAERTYGLRVEVDEPELTGDELAARLTRPIIVLSRHAGPGDSFLLVHQLLSVYHRRPRVVMKAALQLDPSVDIVGNRLPNVWIKSRQAGEHIFTEQIARLARGLDERGALVIFPEGGNWTPGRWRRGIRRLEHLGRTDLAERARDMPNLLPPRPGGAIAAIAACPDADVIFVAHAGLDNIVTIGDVWGKFPIDQVIRARWWRVPSEQYRGPPTMRRRSSGCTAGGSGSTSGSPRTGRATSRCRRRLRLRGTRPSARSAPNPAWILWPSVPGRAELRHRADPVSHLTGGRVRGTTRRESPGNCPHDAVCTGISDEVAYRHCRGEIDADSCDRWRWFCRLRICAMPCWPGATAWSAWTISRPVGRIMSRTWPGGPVSS